MTMKELAPIATAAATAAIARTAADASTRRGPTAHACDSGLSWRTAALGISRGIRLHGAQRSTTPGDGALRGRLTGQRHHPHFHPLPTTTLGMTMILTSFHDSCGEAGK
jgi:hypothetical protein